MSSVEVPEDVASLIDAASGTLRIRILVALEEQGPRSASELARELGEGFEPVRWVLKTLLKAELVRLEREEIRGNRTVTKLFEVRHGGWAEIITVFSKIAQTAEAVDDDRDA